MKITIALIVLNEERNIKACLGSASWADEIVVVDSGSSDHTVELAKNFTSRVYHRAFTNFSEQKNYALAQCTGDWVFFLDADERIPADLAQEIKKTLHLSPEAVYQVKRQTYLFGKKMRYSGTQYDYQTRLFPRGKASFTQPVHERIHTELPLKTLTSVLIHNSTSNLREYRRKLKQYIQFEVDLLRQKGKHVGLLDIFLRPPARFFLVYILQLGILDGLAGFKTAALAAYYEFVRMDQTLKTIKSLQ